MSQHRHPKPDSVTSTFITAGLLAGSKLLHSAPEALRAAGLGFPRKPAPVAAFFDYVFYRVAKFFFQRDGSAGIRTLMVLTCIQGLVPSAGIIFIQRHFYSRAEIAPYAKGESYLFIGLLLGLGLVNARRYPRRYSALRLRWQAEPTPQKIAGGNCHRRCLSPLVHLRGHPGHPQISRV